MGRRPLPPAGHTLSATTAPGAAKDPEPPSPRVTLSYLKLLKAAGRTAPLFTGEAIEEIFQYARGIPRRVNHVCTNALLAAYLEQKDLVDQKLVLKVIQDLNGH